jgi:Tol biopolymer transport system component
MLDPAGGVSTPLAVDETDAWGAVFSPDGSRIVYTSHEATGGYNLVAMNADGSDQHLLSTRAVPFAAAWAPDGDRVAFVSGPDAGSIQVIDFDGTDERTLVTGSWETMSWSPDGSRLAAIQTTIREGCCSSETDLYVVPVTGGGDPVALTADPAFDFRPLWSPDGSTIVFMRDEDPEDRAEGWDIVTIPAEGGSITRLTEWRGVDASPVFSPDGRWIAFVSDRQATTDQMAANRKAGVAGILAGSLFVMTADGSDVRLLVRADGVATPWSWTAAAIPALTTPVHDML